MYFWSLVFGNRIINVVGTRNEKLYYCIDIWISIYLAVIFNLFLNILLINKSLMFVFFKNGIEFNIMSMCHGSKRLVSDRNKVATLKVFNLVSVNKAY